jgi:hypothetical protein
MMFLQVAIADGVSDCKKEVLHTGIRKQVDNVILAELEEEPQTPEVKKQNDELQQAFEHKDSQRFILQWYRCRWESQL